ncbi:cysteine hydrolase [Rhodococcus sp. H29-C3]|uniref:cysteine hydrolase n=1 Tax=Rhodococcus sp. H29-C3 TaxID=3046307 RepID=UPI0024BA5357|nr:cysteine hydrolase [Rhodococcus sp. H29-C3]MDJ0362555.1 cysteine hydrolase [Rhodococcus sp. H29-C3]
MKQVNSTALLEIDFQPWVIELGHDLDAVLRAKRIRERFRREGALVVCTRYLSRDADDPMRSDPKGEGARFHFSMEPQAGDLVATKFDRDIWSNLDLDVQLRLRKISDIVVTGFVTDFGVDLAARTALQLGYRVTVGATGCAGTTASAHHTALDSMSKAGIFIDEQVGANP